MTPEEILADLRDIELPDPLAPGGSAGWATTPFVVLAILLALLALLWWRQGTHWRHEARAELAAALAEKDTAHRWNRLVALLARVSRHRRGEPPACVFMPPERIGPAEIDLLADHIRDRLRAGRATT